MTHSESIKNIAAALSQLQCSVQNPKRTATNTFFKSKYAPLSEVWNSCRDALGAYGLSLIQEPTTSLSESDKQYVRVSISTLLIHASGEWIQFDPLDLFQQKIDPQSIGTVITYGCRYALSSVLGLPSEDDVDGNNQEQHLQNKQTKPNMQNRRTKPKPVISHTLIAQFKEVTAQKVKEGVLPPEKIQEATAMCSTRVYHGKQGDEPLTNALLQQFITKLERLQPKPGTSPEPEPSNTFTPDPACQLDPDCQRYAWEVEQHGSAIMQAAMQDAVTAGEEEKIAEIYASHQTRLRQA